MQLEGSYRNSINIITCKGSLFFAPLLREPQGVWEAVADRLMEEVVLIREMSEESLN
jgi:hypothetical protein